MSKTEEAFNHIIVKLHQAQEAGLGELILHAGTLQEELGWKGLQRVTSGTLARICAYFYCAGNEYSYHPQDFPAFTSRADNIYGSNLQIVFRFPIDKNILLIFKNHPSDITISTVTKDLQDRSVLHKLRKQQRGSHKWLEAAAVAKERGLRIPE